MKKLTLLCIALMSLTILRANVISGTCGDNLTWQYDTNNHSLVISGSGDMWDFDYEERQCPWQTVSGTITSVSLPDDLTRIGSRAFNGCSNLTTIDLPSSLTSIGSYAFYSARFKSLVLPNSVTNIGNEAFCGNSELQSVTLPNNLQTLSNYVFYACYELKSIAIPTSITTIGECALCDCNDVYMESSTPATITNSSFKSNVVIHVPCNSVSAYQAAPIWQFLNIMGNLDYKFTLNADEGGTARITNSVCAANTVVIEATADAGYRFTGWSDGNKDNPRAIVLTADKSVTAQFEQSTTYFHVSLSGISHMEYNNGSYSSNGPNWSGEVLEGSYISFHCIYDCGTFTGWSDGSMETYRNIQITSDTTITANYTGIETYQVSITAGEHGHLSNEIAGEVSSCANSFEVRAIPDDGYHFVEWSDGYESSYRWFNIYSDITVYAIFAKGEEGGKLGEQLYWSFEADKSQITVTGSGEMTEHEYFSEWSDKHDHSLDQVRILTFEEGATSVISKNFNGLHYLETIALPASLLSIGESSFEDCRSLSQVTFAANSSLTSIGNWAFYNCHELQNLVIPEGVTEIGKAAFYGCAYLKDVTLPASIQAIGDNAFALCAKMAKLQVAAVVPPTIAAKTFEDVSREMPVYVPEASVDAYKAAPYWGELNIIGGLTAVETIESTPTTPTKLIRNGQLLILRGDKTYTIQGQEVR